MNILDIFLNSLLLIISFNHDLWEIIILSLYVSFIALMSDGELNEGSNWESFLFVSHKNLNNLTIIIDYNKIQSLDFTNKTIKLEPLNKKFQAFGFSVIDIDGHNFTEIYKALIQKTKKPKIIIANTVKGKGISFMENKILWHYKSPDENELKKGIEELS